VNKVRQEFFGSSQTNVSSLMQTLASLNLTRNEIGPEGADHLSAALKLNKVRQVFFWFFSNECFFLNTDTHFTQSLRE
jgi:hypothetical protein